MRSVCWADIRHVTKAIKVEWVVGAGIMAMLSIGTED
jgi:hypothetical protein